MPAPNTVPAPTWTVSIDTGGTFTDAIARSSDGDALVAKVASTPDDPSRGLTNAVAALVELGMPPEQVTLLCHGTTVATNATLTGGLATIALVTTRGFRDVLGYRQSSRPDVYSLTPQRPMELVERRARLEVDERISSTGEVIVPLTDAEIERIIAEVGALDVEAVAVSLLFSYLDDTHERRIGAALRAAYPELPVTLSSEVAREFREYPRTSTTAMNAALRPVVGVYLRRATEAVSASGLPARFVVMQSNGGSVPAERADAQAHRLVLSGPAGGASGLVAIAETHGLKDVISLDMGGTSTDVCVVRGGTMPFTTTQVIRDHVVLAPTVDIHTIGAGGGSIAWIDSTNRLRVGPQSAKAVPGPASYGRGGVEPTITDAHVVLGTLGGGELAGGLSLDVEAARRAVDRIGGPLGMSTEEAAEAILAIGLAHMVRAVRKVSVERGLDPRDFTLVPFGGAGPLQAGLLLRHLGMRSVLVPRLPGIFSADGLLAAGLRVDASQTVLAVASPEIEGEISAWFDTAAAEAIERVVEDGVDRDDVTVAASIDCRYQGQGFELTVPLERWDAVGLRGVAEAFHRAHAELYGHANRDEQVELVTLRVAVTGAFNREAERAVEVEERDASPARVGDVTARMPGDGESRPTPVYDRALLEPGAVFTGPAIIQQMDSTTVVLHGQTVRVASNGDLLVTEDAR